MKPGDIVEAGQILCIVEAMKLMNEIESDVAGELVKKLVTNNAADRIRTGVVCYKATEVITWGQPSFTTETLRHRENQRTRKSLSMLFVLLSTR